MSGGLPGPRRVTERVLPRRLQAELLEVPGEERAVLWQPMTGRALALARESLVRLLAALEGGVGGPPGPPLGPLLRRLEELGMVGLPPDPGALVPALSRWALLLPEQELLWHALPFARGPGGFPFHGYPLGRRGVALVRAFNGSRSLAQASARAGMGLDEALALLAPLTTPERQALQLRPRPLRAHEPGLARLVAPPRPAFDRLDHHYGEDGRTQLERYHRAEIDDGARHFDDRETTVAHAFEGPHPALGGRSYGEALGLALEDRGLLGEGPVLEIGPGTGALCAALRPRLEGRPYLRLDLSPELLRLQEARCPGTTSIAGSAVDIPLADEAVDLVVCNEVIADLEASPDPGGWPVRPLQGQRLYNTGAFAMVRELARILRPGGAAFVSEFGGPEERPVETTQLDHPEVSVCFGQLAAVAEAEGLEVTSLPLGRLLGVDLGARWLSRPSYEALRARLRGEGRALQARAWTPETLRLPWPTEGLWWVPVTEDGPAPVITRFHALLLRRPP